MSIAPDHGGSALRPVLWLFLFALAPGIWQLLHPEAFGFGHGFEMSAIAKRLAERGEFGNPFEPIDTGPTAVVPPLYPFYLAGLIKILRRPELIAFVATIANVFANALVAGWMPGMAAIFYGSTLPGIVAGLLWIPAARLMPQWDVGFTTAGLVLFCLMTASTLAPGGAVWLRGAAAGAIAGLLSLMNPVVVLVCVLWVAVLARARRVPLPCFARYGLALVLALALMNVPWLIRNYALFHTVVLRTNFGMTLYSSNNDCAESSLFKDGRNGCYQSTHPVASESEARLLGSMGEVEFDRRRTADAMAWIRSHPERFRELTLERIFEFWFPERVVPAWPAYAMWAITALSIPGFILMAVRKIPLTAFLAAVWLLYPLMYYVVVSSDRYRYPILWTSLLAAGFFVERAIAPRYTLSR
jgi:hypothetical protein